MTTDRVSGLLLIAGSAGVIITLSLHPSGRDLFAPGQIESAVRHLVAVHSLALASLPLWFLGACGLSRRVTLATSSGEQESYPLGVAALVLYGFAMAAMMVAVAVDGLVSGGLARQIVQTTGTVGQGWRIAFNYNGMLDQAFVHVFLVASSAAIMVWSTAMVRSRVLSRGAGVYGWLAGAATVIALLSGQLDRFPHLFGLAIVAQAIWFVIVGVLLSRAKRA
jgi:hypothetical protein